MKPTLAEAKAHLRVTTADEDADITTKLTAAIRACEDYTGVGYIKETRTIYRPAPCATAKITLILPPVLDKSKVSVLSYLKTDGSRVALAQGDFKLYQVWEGLPFIKVSESYPFVDPDWDAPDFWLITYESGMDDAVVPVPVQSAALLLLGDLYENREANIVGTIVAENPTVVRLLAPYRVTLGI